MPAASCIERCMHEHFVQERRTFVTGHGVLVERVAGVASLVSDGGRGLKLKRKRYSSATPGSPFIFLSKLRSASQPISFALTANKQSTKSAGPCS